jgi:PadR family transcriptional regulator, regulatory protein AphA
LGTTSKPPTPIKPAEAAILGLLAIAQHEGEELSGYDLKAWTDASVGYFWGAAKSQIYAVLGRLADRGLVTARHVEQSRRPDKNLYRITSRGRKALDAWLQEPPEPMPARNVFLLRVFLGKLASRESVAGQIEAYAESARQLRSELEAIEADARERGESNPYYALTRRYGFALADMVERWAADALRELDA